MRDLHEDSRIVGETPKHDFTQQTNQYVNSQQNHQSLNKQENEQPKGLANTPDNSVQIKYLPQPLSLLKFSNTLNLDNHLDLEDTPEAERDDIIRKRSTMYSKEEVLAHYKQNFENGDSDLPLDFTQNDRINLNEDGNHPDLLDSPLKNKISIQRIRNEGKVIISRNSEDQKTFRTKDKLSTVNSSPTRSDQLFAATLKDNDISLKGVDTQLIAQQSNEMLIPATNSSTSDNQNEARGKRYEGKATQLIQDITNDYDASDSFVQEEGQSVLQQTSIMHTSPINFASFHDIVRPSTQILTSNEEAIRVSEGDQILVQSPSAKDHLTQVVRCDSAVSSDEEVKEVRSQSSSIANFPFENDPLSSELRFKLTYSVKPSSRDISDSENFHNSIDTNNMSCRQKIPDSDSLKLDTNIEVDQTQELPEILEKYDDKVRPSLESQEQLNVSKKRKNRHIIVEEEPEFEDLSTPSKKQQSVIANEEYMYPTELRTSDKDLLTKNDIIFDKAVWYYFTDCNYYPGKIISTGSKNAGYCSVLFEKRENDVKVDDIYYLDIRCGEKVHWKMNQYKIVALECRNPGDVDLIRCIRGYDTVHLRKLLRNGKLSKKTITDTMASIYITTEEWVKRSKIKISDQEDPVGCLRRQIRSRSARASLSPLKRVNKIDYSSNSEFYGDTFHDTSIIKQIGGLRGKIFDGCIFVLSGLHDSERERISNVIELEGGTVMNAGFEHFLHYDSESKVFNWIDPQLKLFKFSCLLSENYSRSPKYLEALALGWPVLHPRFIEQCIIAGDFHEELILKNLLPSGESNRFINHGSHQRTVVKSSNIYQFYTNLLSGLTLEHQLNISTVSMKEYAVFILGQSEMNFFIDFIFQCYKLSWWEYSSNTKFNLDEGLDSATIKQLLNFYKTNMNKTRIIFINETNLLNTSEKETKLKKILSHHIEDVIRIENKEWLVQSIINEEL